MKTKTLTGFIFLLMFTTGFLLVLPWFNFERNMIMPRHNPVFMIGGFLFLSIWILMLISWISHDFNLPKTPDNLLKERLAKGEIDIDTYHQLRKTLKERPHHEN